MMPELIPTGVIKFYTWSNWACAAWNFENDLIYSDLLIDYPKKHSYKMAAIMMYDQLNGWQLAKMKKNIPDMSLP